jgi:hypothetical protein
MTQIDAEARSFPSTRRVATLARPSFWIERFCEIREICGHLRQVFFSIPAEGQPFYRDAEDPSIRSG